MQVWILVIFLSNDWVGQMARMTQFSLWTIIRRCHFSKSRAHHDWGSHLDHYHRYLKSARPFYIYLTSRFSWDPSRHFPLAPQLNLISHGIVNLQHNIQLYIVISKKHTWTPRNHFQTPYRQFNMKTTHQTLHRPASFTSSCTTTARGNKLKPSRGCYVHGARSTVDVYTDCWNISSSHISGSPSYIRCLFICYIMAASMKW